MKKYFSKGLLATFIITSVFAVGAIVPTVVKASPQMMDICQIINLFTTLGIITPEKATTARLATGCQAGSVVTTVQPKITRVTGLVRDNYEIDAGARFSIEGTNLTYNNSASVYFAHNGKDLATITQLGDTLIWAVAPNDLKVGSTYEMYVRNDRGVSDPIQVEVVGTVNSTNTNDSSSPSVTILSPNGREIITQGGMLNVLWNSSSPTQTVGVSIVSSAGGIMQNFVQSVTPSGRDSQSLGFTTSESMSSSRYIPVGQYKARVCSVATHECDDSNNTFTIVAPTTQPFISILSPNGGETLNNGEYFPLSYNLPSDKLYSISYYLIPKSGTHIRYGDGSYFDSKSGGYSMGGLSSNYALSQFNTSIYMPEDIYSGWYKIRAYLRNHGDDNGSPTISTALAYDDSDLYFKVSSDYSGPTPVPVTPIITPTQPSNGYPDYYYGTSDKDDYYGNCDPSYGKNEKYGNWVNTKMSEVKEALTRQSQYAASDIQSITVISCKPFDGPGGAYVVNCPAGNNYTYCVQNQNDGIANSIFLGVKSNVTSAIKPYVTVLSPNGGEEYQAGDTVPIKFKTNLPEKQTPNGITLQLYFAQKGSPGYLRDIVTNYTGGSPYNWTIPSNIAQDLYYIYASLPVTGISLPEHGVSDFSDGYFKAGFSVPAPPSNGYPDYYYGTSDKNDYYGNCDPGYGKNEKYGNWVNTKMSEVKEALTRQSVYVSSDIESITVISCKPFNGPGGAYLVSCPSGTDYTYCVQNQNDGIANSIFLGVKSLATQPSCTITTDKSSYKLGDTITFSWTSKNATYATWQQDTSGKDNLLLPGDKLDISGTQPVTANVIGNPSVTLSVGNQTYQGSCSKTVSISEGPVTQSSDANNYATASVGFESFLKLLQALR